MQLRFVSEAADVRNYAEEQKLSLEEAARILRYRFLFKQARLEGADAVAVGHTADDQVETVLMHFLRGAGLPGLKGMAATHNPEGVRSGNPIGASHPAPVEKRNGSLLPGT